MSDIDILDVIHSMLETDRVFLQTLRFLSANREHLITIQQRNTATLLALLRTYVVSNSETTTFTIPITIPRNLGGLPAGWDDPVVVRPTEAQITAATRPIEISDVNCAICQEAISGVATRIRHCSHSFHTVCINEWFTRSVHCPMCRHDIRAVSHPAPTSSALGHMPPLVSNPSVAWPPAGHPTDHTEDTEESDEHHA